MLIKLTDNNGEPFVGSLALSIYDKAVETFAGGWYGKTVWKEQSLSQDKINDFTRFAFKKMRSELGRRRAKD